jgi:hypothetical protein
MQFGLMAMSQALLFVAVIAGMVSIIPLSIWLATGSIRAAWTALREYLRCMGALYAVGAVLALAAAISSIP